MYKRALYTRCKQNLSTKIILTTLTQEELKIVETKVEQTLRTINLKS